MGRLHAMAQKTKFENAMKLLKSKTAASEKADKKKAAEAGALAKMKEKQRLIKKLLVDDSRLTRLRMRALKAKLKLANMPREMKKKMEEVDQKSGEKKAKLKVQKLRELEAEKRMKASKSAIGKAERAAKEAAKKAALEKANKEKLK